MLKQPRTAARRRQDIPADILHALNHGTLATANLVEALAIDMQGLLHTVCPAASIPTPADNGITKRMQLGGEALLTGNADLSALSLHASDTVRGWVAYALSIQHASDLQQALAAIKPLADDPHFGVREWAWLAVRPLLLEDMQQAIDLLTPWASDTSPNIRRFASEATRPRGVWCAHSPLLRQNPGIAVPLLTPLLRDDVRYVQDSIANWLNDAGKDNPGWVHVMLDQPVHPYIKRRALRNL